MIKDEYDDYDQDYNVEEYYCPDDQGNEETNIGLTKSTSYCIIRDEEIDKLRDRLIHTVEEYTSLSRDESILALLFFQWNLEKLQDKWFENTDKWLFESGINQSK